MRFHGSGEWTVLGLMCGTSLDGLDAARLRLRAGASGLEAWEFLDFATAPYPPALRLEAEALIEGGRCSAAALGGLHVGLAQAFAAFVTERFPAPVADLAAFPGQTLWHDPDGAGFSLQIGSPAAFALLTGLPTVGEFRLPDVLLGGQGAPLVPLADALLHRDAVEARALVNVGGIANVTRLLAEREDDVHGFDPSPESLEVARKRAPSVTFHDDEATIPREHFETVVLSGVLHHVDPAERRALLERVLGYLTVGGRVVVFEHNPLNPLTRRAVADCEFDDDAILLFPWAAKALLRDAGFQGVTLDYIVFFPKALAGLRRYEPALRSIALGAQQMLVGRRPD